MIHKTIFLGEELMHLNLHYHTLNGLKIENSISRIAKGNNNKDQF